MKNLRNKVQLIGNLGAQPEIKVLKEGKKLAKFSLATNETYKNAQGEKVEETNWHNITVWGKLAEIAENYLEKGQEIVVEGKLSTRQFKDENDNTRYYTEIIAQEILMLSKPKA